jgi:hypothetical protein
MRLIVVISLLLGCSASVPLRAFAAGPASSRSKLASYDWSVHASQNLSKNPLSQKEIETFVASIENSVSGDSSLGVEGGTYICSFRFADFRGDGFFSLFAGIGVVDRPSCGDLEVIDKTTSGFELYQSGGSTGAGRDIPANIKDLRHDGKLQFLLHAGLGGISQRCSADWTAVFAWTGDNYTNVSAQFKDFYRARLESLKKTIPSLQPVRGPNGYALSDKDCLEAEAAAIQRLVEVSRDAGIDQAVRLATSKDSAERDFATQLLGEIGTPEARKYLETLTKDSDNNVATDAKSSLSRSANGPMKIVADSFQRIGSVSKF